jgi:hypothetical protein
LLAGRCCRLPRSRACCHSSSFPIRSSEVLCFLKRSRGSDPGSQLRPGLSCLSILVRRLRQWNRQMDIHPIRTRRCHRGRHRPTSPPAFGPLAEGRRRGGRLERGPVTRRLRSGGTCCTGRDSRRARQGRYGQGRRPRACHLLAEYLKKPGQLLSVARAPRDVPFAPSTLGAHDDPSR